MRARSSYSWNAVLATLICWSSLASLRSQAAPIVVTTLADSGAGSLRTAIANANDGDVITFAIAGTITNRTGELVINKNLDIVGPSPNTLTVSGNNSSRVFSIAGGVTVNISSLTIGDGHAGDGAAGTNSATPGWPGSDGGGIYNSGTLALTNCVITQCRSGQGGAGFSNTSFPPFGIPGSSDGGPGGNGGGMYNAGTLMLVNCSLGTNAAGSGGGGGTPLTGGLPGQREGAEEMAAEFMMWGL